MTGTEIGAGIDRLAELAGIEPSYRDYFGREIVVQRATKVALLNALGLDVRSDEAVAQSIERLENGPWLRALEPVTIAMQGTPPRIALTMPSGVVPPAVAWQICEEGGSVHGGESAFAPLATVATRTIGGVAYERRIVELPVQPLLGYHRIAFDGIGESALIVAPTRCYLPPAIDRGAKVWGLAVQLYGLRSARNWGIGDFGDLEVLARQVHAAGGACIGLNPLHALDANNPTAASPYSPSSRLFLNTIYLDIEAIPDFAECPEARSAVREPAFSERLAMLRAATLVDYDGVAAAKRPVLEMLYASFRRKHLASGSARGEQFAAFVALGGAQLSLNTTFEALREHFAPDVPQGAGWEAWPERFHDPASSAVAEFAREKRARVEFYAYLQWNADLQLGAAAAACSGMTVGLYRDLAVGADGAGAEAWSDPGALLAGISVGAPPDAMNAIGQSWGLAPLSPLGLRERAYRPFAALIRANMRHAGALRFDHAMSLQRLFWIPAGSPPAAGAYVRYPFSDLLAIVALESERNACLVVGEDLGTVPEGFRERMQWARILSYRLLYFERGQDGAFTAPDDYPPLALVAPGTHDLPTLPAYWEGHDVTLRAEIGLLPASSTVEDARAERSRERDALLAAFTAAGVLDEEMAERVRAAGAAPDAADLRAVIEAAYAYLEQTRSRLLVMSIEDVLGIEEQINVPGTVYEQPNWRRKVTVDVDDIAIDERFATLAALLAATRALPAPPTVPTSTYRLQFHADFRFEDAERTLPYLEALGITHVYASPLLAARAGSTHGYDIVDHARLNPELGTRADFEHFVAELHRRGMGLVMDFVPNHVGVGPQNAWWQDVLEWGRSSPYAPFFDIDWHPAKPELRGKVLLPFLATAYGDALEADQIRAVFDAAAGTFALTYGELRFPLAPRTYAALLEAAHLPQLAALFDRGWSPRSPGERSRLRDALDAAKAQLAAGAEDAAVAAAIGAALDALRGDALDRIVRLQHYRLASWRVAADEINYRRFFDINDLAGLRVEYAECFARVHQLAFRLIEDGMVQGLRIDHVDGLFDPKGYTQLLRGRALALDHPLYLVVEKILARHETLGDDWLVAGTTGYEFTNLVTGLFVDAANEHRFDVMYRAFTGDDTPFDEVLYAAKHAIMDVSLASELEVLANALDRLAQSDVRSSDFTRRALRNALLEVVAAFPVYRTYVSGDGASPNDRRHIEWAIGLARRRSDALDRSVFDFLGSVLTTDAARTEPRRYRSRDVVRFAMKFQQYTPPVMAKSLEDTAFYRYPRLLALNEVGGDPRRFGTSVSAFHRTMRERLERTPYGLSTTATHDTKRGEDARLRIAALSELAPLGRHALLRFERANRRHKREAAGVPAPDRIDEWMLYQTLVGTWPLKSLEPGAAGPIAPPGYGERIEAYMRKALREAKRHTSWDNPNAEYEEATLAFVRGVLGEGRDSAFFSEFARLCDHAAGLAMVHGIAQLVLKLTAPGIPDIYQGTELWDFNLVDPDNRRPIDWEARARVLAALPPLGDETPALARALLARWRDGTVKAFVTRTLLQLRRAYREQFLDGPYLPLETGGAYADRVVAFERGGILVAVPRLVAPLGHSTLGAAWHDTSVLLPRRRAARRYREAFTGRVVEAGPGAPLWAAELFADFPAAVYVAQDDA
jgi:4-alpha-glucanotransferase/(1->4)-alpha-D-glucan 1-alpha-D-glucosylmutase